MCGTSAVRPAGASARWRAGGLAEAVVAVAGAGTKAYFLCMICRTPDDSFVRAFPAENTESFLKANRAFAHFGGGAEHDSVRQHASRWRKSLEMASVQAYRSVQRVAIALSVCS